MLNDKEIKNRDAASKDLSLIKFKSNTFPFITSTSVSLDILDFNTEIFLSLNSTAVTS